MTTSDPRQPQIAAAANARDETRIAFFVINTAFIISPFCHACFAIKLIESAGLTPLVGVKVMG